MIPFFHFLLRACCHRGGCSKDIKQSCALWVSSLFAIRSGTVATLMYFHGWLTCAPLTQQNWQVKKAAGVVLKEVKALFLMKLTKPGENAERDFVLGAPGRKAGQYPGFPQQDWLTLIGNIVRRQKDFLRNF